MLTPYCTCSSELSKKQYIIGAIMPTAILDIIPIIISIIFNLPFGFFIGLLMFLSGAGDIMIIFKILLYRENGKECKYFDHPTEPGMIVLER